MGSFRDYGGRPGAKDEAAAAQYLKGMERLLDAVQELSVVRSLPEIQRIVGLVSRELTGSDGATFVLGEGDYCHYVDEDAIEPLWKGRRIPRNICVAGWAMTHRCAVVIPDIFRDERVRDEIYRRTFVRSLVMVPIRALDPIGAIGNYWAEERTLSDDELRLLQALADSTSIAMENVRLYEELERRVLERTEALARAKAEIEELSLTDHLTGLLNRRGFFQTARKAMDDAACALVFIDVDGLKRVNDSHGHGAGDAMLRHFADLLRDVFGTAATIGRLGGDEFCIIVLEAAADEAALRVRLGARLDAFNDAGVLPYPLGASLGAVRCPVGAADRIEALIADADRRMYGDKQARKAP